MDELLALVPEENQGKAKELLESMPKGLNFKRKEDVQDYINGLTKEERGGDPIFNYSNSMDGKRVDDLRKRWLEEDLPKHLAKERAKSALSGKDLDALQEQLEKTTDMEKRDLIETKIRLIQMEQRESEREQELNRQRLSNKLHSEGGDVSSLAGMIAGITDSEEKALMLVNGFNELMETKINELEQKYKGAGNQAPKLTAPAGKGWKEMSISQRTELWNKDPGLAKQLMDEATPRS